MGPPSHFELVWTSVLSSWVLLRYWILSNVYKTMGPHSFWISMEKLPFLDECVVSCYCYIYKFGCFARQEGAF